MQLRTLLLVTSALVSCLSNTSHAQTADVLHYWTSGGEAKAIAVFADAFKARGGVWVDNGVTGFDQERSVAMNRIAGGNPPTAMLSELGNDLQSLAKEGMLADVGKAAGDWKNVLPATLTESLSYDGGLVAVPVDIAGRNWMWYSTRILEEVGVEAPKTWDEFFAAADKVKAAGHIPLALGGEAWQEWNLFASVFLGKGGAEFYKSVYEDHTVEAAGSAKMVEVFDTFRKLNAYVDAGSPGRAWNDTTNLVVTDKAAFQIMCDWAKGEFVAAGKTAGTDFGCALSPDTAGAYDLVVDAFIFPKAVNEDGQKAQDLLVEIMMDPAIQVEFNRFKGSLPPRVDADVTRLDACAVIGQKVMSDPKSYVPNVFKAPGADVGGQLEDLVTEFWNTPNMKSEDAAKRFADIIATIE